MTNPFTRRGFLGGATTVGVLSKFSSGLAAAAGDAVRTVSFDGGWIFSRGDFPQAAAPSFADAGWSGIDLPHDWSIAGPYDKDAAAGGSGGYLPTGIGWYRKRFVQSESMRGKRVQVLFDGVYQRSEVWINGHTLGMRPCGYIGFGYDLTPHLNETGRDNVVAVRVDNSLQPNSRWYSGSGIYRHAWLVVTDPVPIANWGICVRATSVTHDSATLEVSVRALNATAKSHRCTLDIEIDLSTPAMKTR